MLANKLAFVSYLLAHQDIEAQGMEKEISKLSVQLNPLSN